MAKYNFVSKENILNLLKRDAAHRAPGRFTAPEFRFYGTWSIFPMNESGGLTYGEYLFNEAPVELRAEIHEDFLEWWTYTMIERGTLLRLRNDGVIL